MRELELSASRSAERSQILELQDKAASVLQRASAAEDLAAELRRQLEGQRSALEGVLAGRDRRVAELQVTDSCQGAAIAQCRLLSSSCS